MEQVMDKPAEKVAKKAEPKKYKLTIHSGEDKAEKGDVVLAHNFRQILIQRDQEVVVDECYIEVLKHSMIDTFNKGEDGKLTPVKVPRFSYTHTPA